MRPRRSVTRAAVVVGWLVTVSASSQAIGAIDPSPWDSPIPEPQAWERLARLISLRDHNTRVVLLGTTLLGLAAGVVGTFTLLRKRALVGDAISHATLPGIGIAFIVMVEAGGNGKYLPGLLLGAVISGLAGMGLMVLIRHTTRIKEDAAMGTVMSVFFGLGIAVLGVIQKMTQGSAAGLESFIYGKTASMLASDATLIATAAGLVVLVCLALYKELTMLCFDQGYAGAQGWPVLGLDLVMVSLVVTVTVIGLQAVGLILMVALLIIPATAARFWTNRVVWMVIVSGSIGAVSGMLGAGLSAVVPRLPTGAIIIVTAGSVFLVSMFFGSVRGVLPRVTEHRQLSRKIGRQHLLRAMYECREQMGVDVDTGHRVGPDPHLVNIQKLLAMRSWSTTRLGRLLAQAYKDGLVQRQNGAYGLTPAGVAEATRTMRNHRLWEMFLITHADIAPSHVDRDADQVEHVLGADMVRELESLLLKQYPHLTVPPSPHTLGRSEAEGASGGDAVV